jgi:hypothetical protein
MNHRSRPQSISWFQDQYTAGRLQLRPPFQRKPVWSDKQRCFLVESVLMDIPIPEVYVQVTQAEDGSEEFGVVDGQQRLRTILQFIGIERSDDQMGEDQNSFTLTTLPSTATYYRKSFADLTLEHRKRFYQFELCVRFLYTEDREEVEDVFKRLNKYTMPLRAQELRNATFHGAFATLSEKLADDEYWAVNRIITPAAIRRMGDIEMMSDLLIGLLHGPQGGSSRIVDQYYEQYEQYEDQFPEQSRVARLFEKTLDTIRCVFPDISDVDRWGNRADFYSLFVAIGNLLHSKELPKSAVKVKGLRTCLQRFAKEVDVRLENPTANASKASRKYARAIEKGSNEKARRMDRHEALTEIMSSLFTVRQ